MNTLDLFFIDLVNKLTQQSLTFDSLMIHIASLDLIKGGVLVGLIWFFWFSQNDLLDNKSIRERLISSLMGCFVALFSATILQLALPFRPRPIHNPEIDFVLPYGVTEATLRGWSSFPSDHAVLFFGLAFSFCLISKKMGYLIISYVIIIILWPRIFLGYHYFTDILAGAILGILFVWVFNFPKIRHDVTKPFLYIENKTPGFFYFCFFIVSYNIATLFFEARMICYQLASFLKIKTIAEKIFSSIF